MTSLVWMPTIPIQCSRTQTSIHLSLWSECIFRWRVFSTSSFCCVLNRKKNLFLALFFFSLGFKPHFVFVVAHSQCLVNALFTMDYFVLFSDYFQRYHLAFIDTADSKDDTTRILSWWISARDRDFFHSFTHISFQQFYLMIILVIKHVFLLLLLLLSFS